jgi:hypothetical protein
MLIAARFARPVSTTAGTFLRTGSSTVLIYIGVTTNLFGGDYALQMQNLTWKIKILATTPSLALHAETHRRRSPVVPNTGKRPGNQEMLFDMPYRNNDPCTVDPGLW